MSAASDLGGNGLTGMTLALTDTLVSDHDLVELLNVRAVRGEDKRDAD